MTDSIDKDTILDAETPDELFGSEALQSKGKLRKAYAPLIRQFTPDAAPDVFAHIRKLYEMAVEHIEYGQDEPLEELAEAPPLVDAPGPFQPETEEEEEDEFLEYKEKFTSYLEEEQYQEASDLLEYYAADFLQDAPMIWIQSVLTLAHLPNFRESEARIKSRRRLIQSLEDLPPDLGNSLEYKLTISLAIEEVLTDPKADQELVRLIIQCRIASPEETIENCLRFKEAYPESTQDKLNYLKYYHPAFFVLYRVMAGNLSQNIQGQGMQIAGELLELPHSPKIPSRTQRTLMGEDKRHQMAIYLSLVLIPLCILRLILRTDDSWIVPLLAYGFIALVLAPVGMRSFLRRFNLFAFEPKKYDSEVRPVALRFLKEHTLWPYELSTLAIVQAKGPPPLQKGTKAWPDSHFFAWPAHHPLVTLEQDEALILDCFTQSHAERVMRSVEAARAEAEAQEKTSQEEAEAQAQESQPS